MVTHRINRVEFELEVAAAELGRRVSDRVSMLNGQRIPSLLDRVCSEVDDAEPIQRIDKLELELGSVALSNFDDELLAKLEAALRLALRGRARQGALGQVVADARPGASRDSNAPEHPDSASHALELLDAYAWTGNLPWWADAREPGLLARHVRDLLVHAPARFVELLREHVDDRSGLDRLARALDGELFAVILERADAGETLPDLLALEHLLALVGVRSERVRAPLLGVLARHGRLEPATVLPAVLRDMDQSVLAALTERLDAQPGLGTASVRAAIADAGMQASQAIRGRHEQLAQHTPRQPESSHEPDAAATEDVRAESERAGDPVEPAERTRSEATTANTPERTATSVVEPEHPEHPATRDALRSRPAPARPDDRQLRLARRRALARLDELYIEDAGLVILWPFIERLFTRVELLDERRFRDEAAQTQAIALLAYLALGDPAPLEQQLAFAKLLCGRSPEQPCELDGPLDDALCDECERLLAAVIDHAPILDAMPIPRFRASFLQRAGVLGVRSGSWLLTVERQPYDLVLERFSWSWAWVKLPWMPDPLTVEW